MMSRLKTKVDRKAASLLVVALFAVIGASILVFSKAAVLPTDAKYYIETPGNQTTYNKDSTLTVSIFAESTQAAVAADLDLTYNSTQLQIQPTNPISTTGSKMPICPDKITSTAGKVTLLCSIDRANILGGGEQAPVTGKNLIATVSFKVLAGSGTTQLKINKESADRSAIIADTTDGSKVNIWDGTSGVLNLNLATQDIVNPVIQSVLPVSGSTVSGNVPISANITDDRGTVSSATIAIDGGTAVDMTAGAGGQYTYSWNSSALNDVAHSIVITAKDPTGNTAVSTTSLTTDNKKPDLVIDSMTVSPASPSVITVGNTVTVTAIIKNNGDEATPANTVNTTKVSVDSATNLILTDTNSASIAPLGTRTVTATWTATLGSHTFTATTDTGLLIAEFSDTNNSKTATITVLKKGDCTGVTPGVPDGVVDGNDLIRVMGFWRQSGKTRAECDLTGPNGTPDGYIDGNDFLEVITNWRK